MATHTAAWRFYQVRPSTSAQNPAACKTNYCIYDTAHNDYLYTKAWVDFLVRELAVDEKYRRLTGPGT